MIEDFPELFGLDLFLEGTISRPEFMKRHWDDGYCLLPGELSRFGLLPVLPLFESWESMVQAHRGLIDVFGKDGVRASYQKHHAARILAAGGTLYLNLSFVGALETYTNDLAADLGCHPDDIVCEGFASKAGSLSTAHADPEHNFHILLRGTKQWRIAKNTTIRRPLTNFVIGADEYNDSPIHRYADRMMPEAMPDDAEDITMREGDVMYFAPGVWHEVSCSEDALSINFAIKPQPWSARIARALELELRKDPEMRQLVFNHVDDTAPLTERFEEVLRARALEALRSVRAASVLSRNRPDDDDE